MSKQNIKTTPQPVETVLERPDLYCVVRTFGGQLLDGVWLRLESGKVLVRASTGLYRPDNYVGFRKSNRPWGPKYTGPIDDEMMANILMFGG